MNKSFSLNNKSLHFNQIFELQVCELYNLKYDSKECSDFILKALTLAYHIKKENSYGSGLNDKEWTFIFEALNEYNYKLESKEVFFFKKSQVFFEYSQNIGKLEQTLDTILFDVFSLLTSIHEIIIFRNPILISILNKNI